MAELRGPVTPGVEADGLRVTRSLLIPFHELEERFTTSGGPGGQHANKAATRAEVRFDVVASQVLGERQRARLLERLGEVVRVVADDERSQARNRALAQERMAGRLAAALYVEPPRRPTKQSRGSKERRLQQKKQRSETKANRRPPRLGD